MEFNEHIEFICVKNMKIACEYKIETKEFNRFKMPFITDKYINVMHWEEIVRTLEKTIKDQIKLDKQQSFESLPDNSFTVDESYRVAYNFLPKDQSYVHFEKLKFTYMLDWILAVKITKLSPIPMSVLPMVISDSQDVVEYNPSQYEAYTSVYTPRCKEQILENKTSPEYSPRSTNGFGASPNKYTPTRIKSFNNNEKESISERKVNHKMTELFGASSCDENEKVKSEDPATLSSEELDVQTRTKKRQNLSAKKFQTKPRTVKKSRTDPDQSTLNQWLSADKIITPTKITKRKRPKAPSVNSKSNMKTAKTESSNALDLFDDGNMQKMESFLERSKQSEIDKNQRRIELKDYEVLDCNDLSRSELKAFVKDFMPKIKKLYENHSVVSIRNQKFNPVLITTSNVLTESQIDFVCREIENQREIKDRGHQADALTDSVLPEFIIYVFSSKLSISTSEALERLKLQEERRLLYDADDLLF